VKRRISLLPEDNSLTEGVAAANIVMLLSEIIITK